MKYSCVRCNEIACDAVDALYCAPCMKKEVRTRRIVAALLLFVIVSCLSMAWEIAKADPLKCIDLNGSESRCLARYETVPVNTLRMVLFADSFD